MNQCLFVCKSIILIMTMFVYFVMFLHANRDGNVVVPDDHTVTVFVFF